MRESKNKGKKERKKRLENKREIKITGRYHWTERMRRETQNPHHLFHSPVSSSLAKVEPGMWESKAVHLSAILIGFASAVVS